MTLRQTTSLLALAAGLLLLPGSVAVGQGKKSDSVVKAKATATKLDKEGKQTVTITLEIEEKYHLYANPVNHKDLEDAQTIVTVTGKEKLKAVNVTYPVGDVKKDKDVGDYNVYKGKVEIKAEVTRAKGDTQALEVTIALQACTDTLCLMPAKVKLSVP